MFISDASMYLVSHHSNSKAIQNANTHTIEKVTEDREDEDCDSSRNHPSQNSQNFKYLLQTTFFK